MLLCLGPFMVYMDATVVSVALPSIQDSLRTDVAGLQWIVDGYTLAFASLLLTAGALGDLIGRRRVFLYGLGGFTACSVLCAVAPSTGLLIAFRVLQGAFGSVTIPLSLALLVEVYAGRDRARAVGVWSGMGGVSLALAGGRRVARRVLRVAEHLLDQYADRHRHHRLDSPGALARDREPSTSRRPLGGTWICRARDCW